MKVIRKIQDLVDRIYVEYMRRKILNNKLEGLTDPTFLDQALAGEKEV